MLLLEAVGGVRAPLPVALFALLGAAVALRPAAAAFEARLAAVHLRRHVDLAALKPVEDNF